MEAKVSSPNESSFTFDDEFDNVENVYDELFGSDDSSDWNEPEGDFEEDDFFDDLLFTEKWL